MGLFNFGNNVNEIEYLPGGNLLNVRLKLNQETGEVKYFGIYSSRASFNIKDVVSINLNQMNDKQAILTIQGQGKCLATFDILPIRISSNMKTWLEEQLAANKV